MKKRNVRSAVDANAHQVQRAARQELKLGDHLRSPYVIRAVDMNVTNEERKIHEWVLAGLGGNELLFSTPNDMNLHRHAIESLARTTTMYISVIDAWVTLLNYEERFRNRDSLCRYFFNIEVMTDTKLRSKCVNHNTQYALFKKGLMSSAKNNLEVVEMRNIDLVFFPLLDKGHYYVVVFNLKNPSVVVIDNRYREVSDDDQLLQMYDFITNILIDDQHLNVVVHPTGRELDEIGQQRLRMDWQTQNNFDDCGVFAMRHMETYMGDVRTWRTGLAQAGKTKEGQIASLRMKYIAKLLVSNYNKKKEYVVKEVEKF
ncbi:Peptidase C48, SUMO/Sentrin/Ubl1 [Cynara cardunculus var. scolymus]|uniref:Peptidase C48, SUMO/Sentrin/Ubl1 n=1 Tax=Cynara cardunculus var. scolymus TaxID=59895 RepID=A0A103XCZ0_CYNCS|nr:Peptidase C48, SUMO/Sentrin/Ubl1 [Cynara cardunculus var. scolymus]